MAINLRDLDADRRRVAELDYAARTGGFSPDDEQEAADIAASALDEIERLDQEVIRLKAESERLRDTLEDLGAYAMKWRMMPNGMRGWYCDGYLTDAKMDSWCDAEGMATPKEIEKEHRT